MTKKADDLARTTLGPPVRSRWAMVGGVAALACAASLTVGASAAVAADDLSDEGLWYYTATGIEQAHQTTTGEGVTVAVIDEGINPAVPELQGVDLTVHEPSYCAREGGGDPLPAAVTDESALHGTSMTSLIVGTGVGANSQRGVQGIAPGVELLFYRSLAPTCAQAAGYTSGDAIRQAVDDGADIINASWGAASAMADVAPEDIAYALAHDVIFVAAAPNASGPSLPVYPVAYNGVVGVAAGRADGQVSDLVVSADFVDVIAPGVDIRALTPQGDWSVYEVKSGTSAATAYTSAALALVWSAYPQATANQVLQSLIRNTGSQDHELGWVDLWGYGTVNVRHMLANDPTQYPDVNPLLTEDGWPTPAEVDAAREAVAPVPSPSVTASQGASDAPSSPVVEAEGGGAGLLVAGVGVLVVVLAGVVTAVVIARRRRLAHDLPTSVDNPSTGA